MKNNKLPPGQHEISALLRWNVDHPGIVPENPEFDPEKWKLTVDGEAENPLRFSWHDFLDLPAVETTSDFHCVEGWSVKNLRWYGVRFDTMVQIARPNQAARSVFFRCSDGYTTSLNIEDLLKDDVLLAYKLNDQHLDITIGGPLRLVVPEKYAYKSAMWIERITFAKKKELGYWEKRGYSNTADVWENDRLAKK